MWTFFIYLVSNVGESHGGLYRAPGKEESERLRERDEIQFIDLRI